MSQLKTLFFLWMILHHHLNKPNYTQTPSRRQYNQYFWLWALNLMKMKMKFNFLTCCYSLYFLIFDKCFLVCFSQLQTAAEGSKRSCNGFPCMYTHLGAKAGKQAMMRTLLNIIHDCAHDPNCSPGVYLYSNHCLFVNVRMIVNLLLSVSSKVSQFNSIQFNCVLFNSVGFYSI
jgi:hypothetical protein